MAERPPGSFRDLNLETRYSAGVKDMLSDFYIPVLSRAVRYDRAAGYFASSSFWAAAAGMARFIENEGEIRLLVGAQLTEDDHRALLGKVPLDEIMAERLRRAELTADDVARGRLQVIAWLVREGRLKIRVGLPCDDYTGAPIPHSDEQRSLKYFHSKYGVLEDAEGDRLAFEGSINESATGWQGNFEAFSVYKSWKAQVWREHGRPIVDEFERLWRGGDVGGWRSLALPQVERRLIELLPAEPGWSPPARDPLEPELSGADREAVDEIRAAPGAGGGVGMLSSGIEPWPHQLAIARRICENRPRSYLLADEVGLGKTIEAGLVLRELLLAGQVERALILAPASLLIQWQEELAEKFLLQVPRLEGRRLRYPGGVERRLAAGVNRWRAAPVLLASSHLARIRANRAELLEGPGWDLVFVDETHHARRRGSKPADPPNQMLATLKALAGKNLFGTLLLASATPMQLHTHDLWDLLDLFGLPDGWNRSAAAMERYYRALQKPFGDRDRGDWDHLRTMLSGFLDETAPDPAVAAMIEEKAGFVESARISEFHESAGFRPGGVAQEARPAWDDWLRANTPVRDRVFRTTRATLRRYRETGVLPPDTVIPERRIDDRFYSLGGAKPLYDRIEQYILRYYDAYLSAGGKSTPLGFIMTVYRRRLTSSFYAIRKSLERRRAVLAERSRPPDLLDEDDRYAAEGLADDLSGIENLGAGGLILAGGDLGAELAELDDFIGELTGQPPVEPKMEAMYDLLNDNFGRGGHDTVVIFTQYFDTLDYIRRQLVDTYRGALACYHGGRGECWDEASGEWTPVGKEAIKERFRRGEVKILLGTDSMSEGLNLQTCGWLINFDLPWNFTRVEQRIGRVDRIGGRPEVQVSNFFYQGTVEEDIYRRIRDSHDWFSNVVGSAAPVLAAAEDLISEAAMGRRTPQQAARRIEDMIDRLDRAAVRLEDLDSTPRFNDDLRPAMTLPGLRDRLLSIATVRDRLTPYDHPHHGGAYRLTLGGADHPVTFDPALYQDKPDLHLLTWGNPLLDRLLTWLDP